MKNNGYKPRVPDIMEAVFDIGYLLFDLIAAVLFFVFSKGNSLFVLYGILTLTLCGGDAFHLVPRVIRAFRGSSDKIKKQLGMGLQISSVTMTVFYILLMYIWKIHSRKCKFPPHWKSSFGYPHWCVLSYACCPKTVGARITATKSCPLSATRYLP